MRTHGVEEDRRTQHQGVAGKEFVMESLKIVLDDAPAGIPARVDFETGGDLQPAQMDLLDLHPAIPDPLHRM